MTPQGRWPSALEEGAPFRVPNFKDEADCRACENDHWSPLPPDAGPGQRPLSVRGTVEPSPDTVAHAREVWAKHGYCGD